ncbi:hypothetical protein ABF87_03520 [Nitrosomonas sp. JL21]|uniref:Ig-like domain-containing protein n=1 Tax=Nitrosomonas sp. JL21 TaxID=153949 RepID=UPI00136DAF40|nr:Ig-like domain-containing protein [Nitrosomonas sp. JL21]MBL8496484.1 Ig-like domain-containing protein [Nitrosomonas sp.]MXS77040.1 hypothetical protein [Nitrosomonas sp. JL21]
MSDEINFDFTVNDLLRPSISNTVLGAEPRGKALWFVRDLFPNMNELSFNESGADRLTSVKSTFKVDDDIVFFYFDEMVKAGTGSIVLSSPTDTRLIDVNDATQITFGAPDYRSFNPFFQNREEFGVVTINPSADLQLNTEYTIQVADGVFLDRKGNPQPGFNDASFTTIASTPQFASFNEVIPVDGNLQLHFDETVKPVKGEIILSNGNDVRTIDINDESQVTFEGDVITVDPAEDLLPDSTYDLEIESGVITDEAGHPMAEPISVFYETYPPAPEQFILYVTPPERGWENFKADADFELQFNKTVKAGSGNLVLSNGTDLQTIAMNDQSQVTFEGSRIIINPAEDLVAGTTYTAHMASGAITDSSGISYEGFTDAHFSTIEAGPLWPFLPGERFENVKINQVLRFFFDEKVVPGNGNITISNGVDIRSIDIHDISQVTFDESVPIVAIRPELPLQPNTTYTLQVPASAITDIDGNRSAAESNQLTIDTIDSAPLVVGSYPIDGASVRSDQPLILRFDEKIIAGEGNLILSNGTDQRTIAITDRDQVLFNGRSVIFDLDDDLVPGTLYTAQMANGVITDVDGNAYGGFSNASFTVQEAALVGIDQAAFI